MYYSVLIVHCHSIPLLYFMTNVTSAINNYDKDRARFLSFITLEIKGLSEY